MHALSLRSRPQQVKGMRAVVAVNPQRNLINLSLILTLLLEIHRGLILQNRDSPL